MYLLKESKLNIEHVCNLQVDNKKHMGNESNINHRNEK